MPILLGRIIYTNRAAEQQIENGKVLRIENNRLVPIDRTARARLATVIDEAIADDAAIPRSGFSVALPAREGGGLVAAVLPLHGGERRNLCGAFAAMAAIFVQDPIVVTGTSKQTEALTPVHEFHTADQGGVRVGADTRGHD